jgi:hypothetical protein
MHQTTGICVEIWQIGAILVASHKAEKAPWIQSMRRIPHPDGDAAWMAPETVVHRVEEDFLQALEWLQSSVQRPWAYRYSKAPELFVGSYLRRHQRLLLQERNETLPLCYGVLRADHDVLVRGFSRDGMHCWLIDRQTQRRMATYDARTSNRVFTQHLADGACVYQLSYDGQQMRWKIEEFIQEMHFSWSQAPDRTNEPTSLPHNIGRDA